MSERPRPVARRGLDRRQFFKARRPRHRLYRRVRPRPALRSPRRPPRRQAPARPQRVRAIGDDDTVTVLLAHSEMGQGIWTTLRDAHRRGARAATGRRSASEHAPAAPVYAHTRYRHADDRRLDARRTASSIATARSARSRASMLVRGRRRALEGRAASSCKVENGVVIARRRTPLLRRARRRRRMKLDAARAGRRSRTRRTGSSSASRRKRLDTPEKITGKAQFGIDVQFPGHAHRGRRAAARLRRQASRASTRTRRKAVPGVREVVQVPRRRRGRRGPLLGGEARARCARGRVGPRAGRAARHAEAARGVPRAREDAGRRRRRLQATLERRFRSRREDARGRLRGAVPRARADGAAQLHRADRRRPLRDLDRHAVPDGRPDGRGEDPGHPAREGHDPHDVPRRRLRPAREADEPTSSARPCRSRRRPASRSRSCGRARTTSAAATTARRTSTGCASASTPQGSPVAWEHVIVGQSILAGTPFEAMMVKNGIDSTSVEGAPTRRT